METVKHLNDVGPLGSRAMRWVSPSKTSWWESRGWVKRDVVHRSGGAELWLMDEKKAAPALKSVPKKKAARKKS